MTVYKTVVKSAANQEPVTLQDAKAQLRVESTVDDTYISALISGARDRIEGFCNRYFTEQSIDIIFYRSFPSGDILLPYPDLQSVDSVKYTDSDNVLQTVDPGDYTVDLDLQIIYTPDSGWPSDSCSFRVSVTTGAPEELGGVKSAILMVVTDLYETRTESVIAASVSDNPAVNSLLYQYRESLGIK